MLDFNNMVDMYRASFIFNSSYITYLNSVDNNNHYQTATWLNDIIINKSKTPLNDALDKFDYFFGPSYNTRWKVAFKDLAQVVLGLFYANVWLELVLAKKSNINLLELLAACAIFADKSVVNNVISGYLGSNNPGNPFSSWDNCLRVRNNTLPSGTYFTTICGITSRRSDNNTYAGRFIKTAILHYNPHIFRGYSYRCFTDYMACHIWGNPTCPNYYSSIPNLVLLPSAIGGLTDYFQPAKDLLRYRSVDLFGRLPQCTINPVCPENIIIPSRPKNYHSIIWRKII